MRKKIQVKQAHTNDYLYWTQRISYNGFRSILPGSIVTGWQEYYFLLLIFTGNVALFGVNNMNPWLSLKVQIHTFLWLFYKYVGWRQPAINYSRQWVSVGAEADFIAQSWFADPSHQLDSLTDSWSLYDGENDRIRDTISSYLFFFSAWAPASSVFSISSRVG